MSWWEQLSLSPEQKAEVASSRHPLETVLEGGELGLVEVMNAASAHFAVPWVDLHGYQPDKECVALVPEAQARRFRVCPLFRVGDHLYLAVEDPTHLQSQDFISRVTGLVIEPVLALGREIDEALNRSLLTTEQASRFLEELTGLPEEPDEFEESGRVTVLEDTGVPTIKLVDHIISQAIRLGASDLHLEPFPHQVLLRYRIDGVLREFPAPPRQLYNGVISRIKIASGLDIAERRLPQDGRASQTVDGRKYDLRVSVIPNLHGEGVVIRILNAQSVQLDLRTLGFEEDVLKRYESILTRPHGIVLVTGPTGSGKSTTLYATLNKIRDVSKKLITLEDPVEYQLPGVTQIQVQPDIGYTFAEGLKAILRHDPDVVLVGEIRDLESAQIAIRAALTGHQMFSTLHTNDAPQAITRLIDMGVPLYQIQAALNGVLAQRLVRRLCASCKQPEALTPAVADVWGFEPDTQLYRSVGCAECNGIGFRGRLAVHELLDVVSSIRRLGIAEAQPERIAELAEHEGAFFSLRRSLGNKLRQGLTTVEEATGLLGED